MGLPRLIPKPRRPHREELRLYLCLVVALSSLFILVYGGLNELTAWRPNRLRLYAAWELGIPLVPWMVLIYFSIFPVFLLPLFYLDTAQMKGLAKAMGWATIAAGVSFLLFPAELGFARPSQLPAFAGVFQVIYWLDRPHNLVPSLHICYSAQCLWWLARFCPAWRWPAALWLLLLSLSVLLVHQHHLLDVVSALPVAWLCSWMVLRKQEGCSMLIK